jgi:hypothetical protein
MKSPYVCAICGQAVMIGRHKGGWRHCAEVHSDHPVKRVKRTDYEPSSRKDEDSAQQAGCSEPRDDASVSNL